MKPLWPPSSLGIKLGLVLFLLVASALAIVYLAVVPRLENRIVSATYHDLERAAIGPGLSLVNIVRNTRTIAGLQAAVDLADSQQNARAVLFRRDASLLRNIADSGRGAAMADDSIARKVFTSGQIERGRVEHDGREYAEVGVPVDSATVLLLAAPLSQRLGAVSLVRRDMLIAGGIGLAVSWIVGAVAAVRFSRRIHRLELAAERIADGDFDAPIVDEGADEVADLARTFDRMRVRLAQLDGARREFIANASHELRTPLFALGGFLELLADEEMDDATRRDFLETARGQVDRLTRLATDLLDLSRLDADQVGMASEPVNLSEAARELGNEFGPLADSSGHVLSVGGADDVIGLGDEQRVLQIGRSLVENALRHTPPGTGIELRAAVFVDRAELSVADNGPGIAAADQERVFERFFRAEGGASFGSGIGLSIARELAQRMGGTIELRSEHGRTVFTLVLRRAASSIPFPRENALV